MLSWKDTTVSWKRHFWQQETPANKLFPKEQMQEMYRAVDGEGAYKGNTKITVSQMADIGKASIVLDPGYHPQGVEKISDAWGKLRPNVGNVGVLNAIMDTRYH